MQPGPSISICPKCRAPKDPQQWLCTNCNTRSCPNGHIVSETERICSQCGLQDRQLKPSSTLYTVSKSRRGETATVQNICPVCKNRVSPNATSCTACGALIRPEFEDLPSPALSAPPTTTNVPLRKESIVVQQETIGHRDTKRTYLCPQCKNRVDDPSGGRCYHCGYVGPMQYDLTRKQPSWAEPQQKTAPVIPPRQRVQEEPSIKTGPQKPAKETIAPTQNNCPNCGTPNPEESRFCRACGYRYGIGKLSQTLITKSTAERSFTAATAPPKIYEPIYADETAAAPHEIPVARPRKKQAPPKARISAGKQAPRIKKRELGAERKFPLGLLMAVMIVAAMIIGLAIFVISQEFRGTFIPTGEPPVITDVKFNTTSDGNVLVEWVTDKPSTSQIMFCDPDGLCSWTEPDTTLVRNHSMLVSGLKPDMKYHITIKSIDSSGNVGEFETDQMFTGNVGSDTKAPQITELKASAISDISIKVTWNTDEPSTSQVMYGTTQSYEKSTSKSTVLTTFHSVTITNLNPQTSYYIKAVSEDAAGNKAELALEKPISTQTSIPVGINKGNRAPDFTLNSLAGTPVSLSSLSGKIVLINFWATWCGPCVAEMPYLQAIKNSWSGTLPLEILAINVQESAGIVQPYIQSQGYTFNVLLDPGNVKGTYGVSNLPTSFFINTQGIIKEIKVGSFNNQSEIVNILNTMD